MHAIALVLLLLPGPPVPQQPGEKPAPDAAPKPAPPLPMAVLGAAGDGLKLSRPTPDFRHEIRIASTSEKPIDVRIEVPKFTGPDSNQTPVTLTIDGKAPSGPLTVPANGTVVVAVSATLPLAGSHTTSIDVLSPGWKPLSVPIVVTRTRAALTAQFKDVVTVQAESGEPVVARFALYENGGQNVKIYRPELSGLALLTTDGKQQQAAFAEQIVEIVAGASATKLVPDRTTDLAAGALQPFRITLTRLDQPGQYAGKLRVASPDASMVEESITLLVRASAWYAGTLIFLGVVASLLLRWYYESKRPQLLRSRQAAVLLDAIAFAGTQPGLDDEARRILIAIRSRVNEAFDKIALEEGTAADAVFAEVKAKLSLFPKWVSATAHVTSLRPPEIALPFWPRLKAAARLLGDPRAAVAALDAAEKTLDELPREIDTALQTALSAAITAFGDDLARREKAGHSAATAAALARIRSRFDAAVAAQQSGDLSGVLVELNAIRAAYVQVLVDELDDALQGPAPAGLANTWKDVVAGVRSLLAIIPGLRDPQRALDQYAEARRFYLRSVLEGLNTAIAEEKLVIENTLPAQMSDETRKRLVASLAQAKTIADGALTKTGAGDLDGATADYRAAAKLFRDGQAGPAGAVRRGVTAVAVTEAFMPGAAMAEIAATSLEAFPALAIRRPTTAALTAQLMILDALVSLAIAAIAVMMGVNLLWAADATWGGLSDYLAAVLWGLGLHQASFQGFKELTDKFRPATAP